MTISKCLGQFAMLLLLFITDPNLPPELIDVFFLVILLQLKDTNSIILILIQFLFLEILFFMNTSFLLSQCLKISLIFKLLLLFFFNLFLIFLNTLQFFLLNTLNLTMRPFFLIFQLENLLEYTGHMVICRITIAIWHLHKLALLLLQSIFLVLYQVSNILFPIHFYILICLITTKSLPSLFY